MRKLEIGLAVITFLIIIYVLFFKPNPLIRLDTNKLKAKGGDSALLLEAPSDVNGVGKKFTVNVKLDTKGYSVNAVQSYLEFDPSVVEVTSTDTTESFCKFYPENNFDNQKGVIKLACGSPYPGFMGVNNLEKIIFTTKAIKPAEIKLSKNSMVLANDGKGTNLLHDLNAVTVQITAGL